MSCCMMSPHRFFFLQESLKLVSKKFYSLLEQLAMLTLVNMSKL